MARASACLNIADSLEVGLRSSYVATFYAAPLMLPQQKGLVAFTSSSGAVHYAFGPAYGVPKAGTDKMAADMGHELQTHGVTVVSIYPGLVRTENVLASGFFDLSNSESPEFIGRGVAALAADPDVARWNGKVAIAAALGREYGFTDIDGKQPQPLTWASS